MVVRKEVHSRSQFAYRQAEYWHSRIKHFTADKGGNVLSCKATIKFLQARRIYVHYCNEYQKCQNLPLLK